MKIENKDFIVTKIKGVEYKSPLVILKLIYHINKKIKRKLDSVLLITGEVGVGKSSMAQLIAGLFEYSQDRELGIDNFTWTTEGLIEFTDRDDNETHSIVWDESIQGGTGRDSLTKIGNQLKVTLVTKRRKRHLYIFIVDEMQEYSKKIISRADYLIDVRFRDRNYARGNFKIFPKRDITKMYHLFKSNAIRHISQYDNFDNITHYFRDPTDIFIDEGEYEAKKIEETKMHSEQQGMLLSTEQRKAIKLKLEGLPNTKIGEQLNRDRKTIGEWFRKLTAGV